MKSVLKAIAPGLIRRIDALAADGVTPYMRAANDGTSWNLPPSPPDYPKAGTGSYLLEPFIPTHVRVASITIKCTAEAIAVDAPPKPGFSESKEEPRVRLGIRRGELLHFMTEPVVLDVGPPRTLAFAFASAPWNGQAWTPDDFKGRMEVALELI